MLLQLNGKQYETRTGLTVSELLQELEIDARRTAVAVNGEVVRQNTHHRHELHPGDQVEVIHAVAGG